MTRAEDGKLHALSVGVALVKKLYLKALMMSLDMFLLVDKLFHLSDWIIDDTLLLYL